MSSLDSRAPLCDVRAPILFGDGREMRVVELRARHEWDWENKYIVEMDLWETSRGDSYSVWVTINWEARYNDERHPSERTVFGLARTLVWEHFETHRQKPCLSQHPFPIRLEF